MTLSFSKKTRDNLLDALEVWYTKPLDGSKQHYHLRHWQQMAGWLNWAFNVYPLLRPCLNIFYAKTARQFNPSKRLHVNDEIRKDFIWASNHIKHSDGVRLVKASDWDVSLAHFTIYCDACPGGMGFWYPDFDNGCYCDISTEAELEIIYFYEALCVFCAIRNVSSLAHHGARVVIYTDNFNTVHLLNSLKCSNEKFNKILKSSIDILIETGIDLRVLHVPGTENVVADALSRKNFHIALDAAPQLTCILFQPPLWSLGAVEK
jgi:hypothetical protein